jgi:hypothetical protein
MLGLALWPPWLALRAGPSPWSLAVLDCLCSRTLVTAGPASSVECRFLPLDAGSPAAPGDLTGLDPPGPELDPADGCDALSRRGGVVVSIPCTGQVRVKRGPGEGGRRVEFVELGDLRRST